MEEKNKIKCPNCGKTNIEIKRRNVGAGSETGMPEKPSEKQLKCNICGHDFGYAESAK